ncbi:TetR/AcrR family transcriptional regulator [Odoribacter sp. Z80]|uniref:TetR/AcrR family transcriptional regulator n=1 Tax=Odoribacter sp. Z80 TaxID=2304575 RepID=UPI00137AFE7D|nr:TetR/AcrR family transcriptional regulator [Odoribacter sp. Z80]NCE72160.1 TetR/AcrR family transcriptional regulator [Odoribacter sp. Z80]
MTESEFYRTKEELLENISELFLKYGLRSTSMDDICSHLKISKKTLYQFFSNKDDLVEQVLLQRRDSRRIQKDLEQLKQHNSIEIMLSIRDHIITSLNSQMPANLFDLKKYHPDIYQRVNEKDQIFIQNLFHEVIEKGIRESYFRNDIHREVQVYLFVKQMAFLGEPELMSEIKYPLDIIVSTIVENVIRSFATPRGIEELEKLLNKTKKYTI